MTHRAQIQWELAMIEQARASHRSGLGTIDDVARAAGTVASVGLWGGFGGIMGAIAGLMLAGDRSGKPAIAATVVGGAGGVALGAAFGYAAARVGGIA